MNQQPTTNNQRPFIIATILAIIAFALDQLSKDQIIAQVALYEKTQIEIFPFFNLVFVMNKGVSFGMFASHNQPLILIAVSAVIMLMLLVWLFRSTSMMVAVGIGLVLGGAAGNVLDRVRYGAVVDFLDFYIGELHWPAFNLADSFVFIGVVVLCVHSIFFDTEKPTRREKL